MNPTLIRYVLRGFAGNEDENEPLDLGDEVVVVLRAQVSKTSARTNGDGVVVADVQLTATAALVLDDLPAGLRKQLDAAAADRIAGADRLAL